MKNRLINLPRQIACLAVAAMVLFPSWTEHTRVFEMVFGVAWLSFILSIFVTKPAPARSDYSSSSSA